MNLLTVGAGMYVTGRDNTGTGTILASILETSKTHPIEEVLIVSRSERGYADVEEASRRLNGTLGTEVSVRYQQLEAGRNHAHFNELLATGTYDACIISTPDATHFAYAKIAMQRACPTLVVKPLVPTLAENEELVRLQDEHETYGAVEFHKRWDDTNLFIRRQLAAGAYGDPLYMVVEYSQRISIPTETFASWIGTTNIFQYLGVHYVDMAYFLTGYQPQRLTAYGTRGGLQARGIDAYDSVHVNIVWQHPDDPTREFWTTYNTNWVDPETTTAMSDQKYFLVGTGGRIECDQKHRGLEETVHGQPPRSVNPYFSDFLPDDRGGLRFDGYGHRSVRAFLTDVLDLRAGRVTVTELEKIRPTFRSSLVSSAVVEAVNDSLANQAAWTAVNL